MSCLKFFIKFLLFSFIAIHLSQGVIPNALKISEQKIIISTDFTNKPGLITNLAMN